MKITDGISIPRELVKVGIVTQDAIFTKGSICANLMLYGKEIEALPFYSDSLSNPKKTRGILFGIDEDKMAVDLINDTAGIKYPAMNITPNLVELQREYDGFAIAENYSLETLLKYLNFPEEMTISELEKLRKILISKKELRKLAVPCGYGKIDTRKTCILDYEQEGKLGFNEYYKFIGKEVSDNERVVFDKNVPAKIKQQIYPARVFELLVQNRSLGYDVTDNIEYKIAQKRLIRK